MCVFGEGGLERPRLAATVDIVQKEVLAHYAVGTHSFAGDTNFSFSNHLRTAFLLRCIACPTGIIDD